MKARYWLAALTLSALTACATTPANTFRAALSGANERPNQVTTNATGTATLTLNETAKTFTLDGSYTGVTATAAHIHAAAGKEATAGVLCHLSFDNNKLTGAGTTGTACNSLTLTDQQITDLKGGLWYVNVHSAANPGGEIRGQLEKP